MLFTRTSELIERRRQLCWLVVTVRGRTRSSIATRGRIVVGSIQINVPGSIHPTGRVAPPREFDASRSHSLGVSCGERLSRARMPI